VIVLSPFEVSAATDQGYSAATTLAGNRLNTELRDVGNAIQVITTQFLKDTGAVNNETLLTYTTSTEVGSTYGNFTGLGDGANLSETGRFTNPSANTRVRGLTNADNTRDYFLTDIPWDGYNIDRIDLSRGPNSILFGQGSPAGIINAGTKPASFRNANEVDIRVDDNGSLRASVDINRVILKDELAIRVIALRDDTKFKQKPAFRDDHRIFGAIRYEPGFLKKGSARTILKANAEAGNINSNNSRNLPPYDNISPWFWTGTVQGRFTSNGNIIPGTGIASTPTVKSGDPRTFNNLNKLTTNPHLAQNDNFYRSDIVHGLTRPAINGGPYQGFVNPWYNPWIGNMGSQIGGPIAYIANANLSTPTSYIVEETRGNYGINTSGTLDRGVGGFNFNRLAGVASYSTFARNAGLPYSEFGVYKDKSMTDPTIFDFYNNLLEGPNKKEWQKFNVFNVSLSQTFLNDKVGFDLTYNRENYSRGQLSFLGGGNQSINIDLNRTHTDGTNNGTGTYPDNIPFEDGTKNENLGRAYIGDNGSGGNNSFKSLRTSKRATAFVTYDFTEGRSSNWITTFLGKHTLTGLWAQDEQNTDSRNWSRYAITDPAWRKFLDLTSSWNEGQNFLPSAAVYLGQSLLNASSAHGANLPRPDVEYRLASGTVRVFDSHWGHSLVPGAPDYVNPAAEWLNNFFPSSPEIDASYAGRNPPATNPHYSFQAENPANYVGWTNMPLNITDSEAAAGNRDLLTTSAQLQRKRTTSKVLVWQGHLLDNALVGTFGIRKDRAQGWSRSVTTNSGKNEDGIAQTRQYNYLNLTPDAYYLPKTGSSLEQTSKSWSMVAHFDELPGIRNLFDKLPIRVSAFYSRSTNFQPEALRVDIYGEQIPLPSGTTKDYGLLFETKDGKYSLRVNKYETAATYANSQGFGGAGFIGNSQVWGGSWANQYEYDLFHGNQPSDAIITWQVNNRPAGAPQPPGWEAQIRPGNPEWDPTNSIYNFDLAPDDNGDRAKAAAKEKATVDAWRAWQKSVDPRFYQAWGLNLNDPFDKSNPKGLTASVPNGFALTEDSSSKGYEIELTAQPTRNWRVAVNAAKTEATRSNIGGKNLAEFIAGYEKALTTTPAGDMRIWWGGSGNETALYQWYANAGGEWAQRKLQEGTNVPELREWRVNAITNYDFTEGLLKGVSVGTSVRWQSEVVIGYRPVPGATARELSFDISHPYMGPAETNVDFWIGYSRKLTDKINWRIQFNVRNATQGDDLIPITVEPDGSPASYRIAPPRLFVLSNTFSF
jgi:outer membrane receptor protein involved in Fe transport